MARKSGSQGLLIGYEQAMKHIDKTFSDRLHNVRMLWLKTAQEMEREAKGAQMGAETIKKKTKGQDEETANANVSKAVEYAKAHSGTIKNDRGVTWVNRTKRAVRGITAIVEGDTEKIGIKLSHGIYYGAYLEYGYGRRFAVLEPVVRQFAPKLIADTRKIMGGKK